MYKAVNGLVPSYISDLLPPTVSNVSRFELRNSNNISRIPTTTSTFSKSCIPSAINEWNNLEASLRESETFNSFCYTLKHNSQHKVPKYFIDGKRKFSIIHARLRNLCSNLNYDLFYNHLRPDSICDCLRDEETAEHYFFLNVFAIQIKELSYSGTHVTSIPIVLVLSYKAKKHYLMRITLVFFSMSKYTFNPPADLLEHIYTKQIFDQSHLFNFDIYLFQVQSTQVKSLNKPPALP